MAFFGKKFTRVSMENVEELMDALKVDERVRAFAKGAGKSVTSFLDNGDGTYTHSMVSETRPIEYKFKLGEQFDMPRPDGVIVKNTFTLEGNKLVQKMIDDEGRNISFVREFADNSMTMTVSVSGQNITAKIRYEAV